MTHKERSNHLVNWINCHPLINIAMLAKMSGCRDMSNLSKATRRQEGRLISQSHIDAIEKNLLPYGFTPFKTQQADG